MAAPVIAMVGATVKLVMSSLQDGVEKGRIEELRVRSRGSGQEKSAKVDYDKKESLD